MNLSHIHKWSNWSAVYYLRTIYERVHTGGSLPFQDRKCQTKEIKRR